MTDLVSVLPEFDTASYSHILPSLERAHVNCCDLLTQDPLDIAKTASVPSAEVRRLKDDLDAQLQAQLSDKDVREWRQISTLDADVDELLGGGFPAGYLCEITGESAAGKTQLLLTLCLAVQLPAPHGLGRSALYITTEGPLQTSRLAQILSNNPMLQELPAAERPSLSRIHSIKCPDLESQEHILTYQVPVVIERHNIGLLIIDSVAANFRAEFDLPAADDKRRAAFTNRTAQIVKLGTLLRQLAQRHDMAIVVANQVLDRFSPAAQPEPYPFLASQTPSSQASRPSSSGRPGPILHPSLSPAPLRHDHQHRWTTGWTTLPSPVPDMHATYHLRHPKTPSLGLAWTTQLAARIVLLRSPVYKDHDYRLGLAEKDILRWRRGLGVAFAPWASDISGAGSEVEIWSGGVRTYHENKAHDDSD